MDEYKEKNIKYLKKYKKLKNQIGGMALDILSNLLQSNTNRVQSRKVQQQTPQQTQTQQQTPQQTQQKLPEGWKEFIDQNTGRKYYANDNTKQTQWEFPIQKSRKLPPGWEEFIDQTNGRKYYANHNTKQTQWKFPIEESQPILNTSQQQTSQQVQQQEIINSLKKNWVNSTDNQKIIYTNNWCNKNFKKARVICKKTDDRKIIKLGEIISTVDLNKTHYHFPPWN